MKISSLKIQSFQNLVHDVVVKGVVQGSGGSDMLRNAIGSTVYMRTQVADKKITFAAASGWQVLDVIRAKSKI